MIRFLTIDGVTGTGDQPLALSVTERPVAESCSNEARIDAECVKLGLTQRPATRADLSILPAISALGTDNSGLPLAYRNNYYCTECALSWVDEWSCSSDDECPCCGHSIEVETAELLIPDELAILFELLPEVSWDQPKSKVDFIANFQPE